MRSGLKELPVSTVRVPPGNAPAYRMPLDFAAAVKRGELPYGAAMVLPFLRSGVLPLVRRDLGRYGYAHLFLHNLQVALPPTRIFRSPAFLIRNPGCVQFSLSSRPVLQAVLRRHRVVPVRELVGC
jgi:hypothetical protein